MSPNSRSDPRELTIVTGMSGAGRSTAAKCLEDLGYFVIDNLPPGLIPKVVELGATGGVPNPRMALVTDVRGGVYFDDLEQALDELALISAPHYLLFLDASSSALVRRFEEVRRPHPLSTSERVIDSIAEERTMLESLKARADLIIDTTDLNVHQLRAAIRDAFAEIGEVPGLQVSVVSFGYKHGIPIDADLVFDVRFLPNPHWIEELRPLTGTDEAVRDYVMGQEATTEFVERLEPLLEYLVPAFAEEGKAHLTIAVGCTGGRHRSVTLAEKIGRMLAEEGANVRVRHRDVARVPAATAEEREWKRPGVGE